MTTLHEMAEAARKMANEKMSDAGHAPASNISERRELAAMTDAPDNQTNQSDARTCSGPRDAVTRL